LDFVVFKGQKYPVEIIEPRYVKWEKEIRQLIINNPNIKNLDEIEGLKSTNLRVYLLLIARSLK
jgi:hypothetical protein